MNVERLIAIAIWLEAGAPEKDGVAGFTMRDFGVEIEEFYHKPWWIQPDCGTACCIAGTALRWWNNLRAPSESLTSQAARLLGITEEESECLFYGRERHADGGLTSGPLLGQITPARAARCIRKFIATGEVDWTSTEA